MNDAVGFALLSLACAGVSDVVLKTYSSVERSRGAYVLGIGLVWTTLQAAIVWISGESFQLSGQTLAFGIVAGVILALSNTLLIESLVHIDVSLASTIYRLNTVAVVVMAVFLLAEPLTEAKVIGVVLGAASVGTLFDRHSQPDARARFMLFFGLAILASLLRACFGVLAKAAVLRGVDLQALLLVNAPVWMLVGAAYAFRKEGRLLITGSTLRYSMVSGALFCGVANFLMLAVARGEASVVVPIANMSFLVALLLSAALGMERLNGRKLLAIGLAVAAIVVLSRA